MQHLEDERVMKIKKKNGEIEKKNKEKCTVRKKKPGLFNSISTFVGYLMPKPFS